MTENVPSALFVYTDETEHLLAVVKARSGSTQITSIEFDDFMQDPESSLQGTVHIVVAGVLSIIKAVLRLASQHGISVGIVPMDTQSDLIRYYDLPRAKEAAIDLALRADGQAMDLVLCNDQVLLFKATISRIPLLDAHDVVQRLRILPSAIKRFFTLKMRRFNFTTADGRKINTVASGCIVIQHHTGSLVSRLIDRDCHPSDGMFSVVVSAPRSVMVYLAFLFRLFVPTKHRKQLPDAIGYIKSSQIDIQTEKEREVLVDGEKVTHTPLHCKTIPAAVTINLGPKLRKSSQPLQTSKEIVNADHLPRGKELIKAQKKEYVPFFSYASEERFRELFVSLRADAHLDTVFVVLMILSTMLATVGLFLDNASVIIGAMLLAPLMAPIVSLAMGILRNDERMLNASLGKIFIGISIALIASAMIALFFPHEPVTDQMQARLDPTLLDLAIAILSGIAGAYSKSFKEIGQSLAGVAIAVALVPPLAVAGIGIGRLDYHFFFQAFLLFSTNLIGIVMAASLTFRVLGYSAAIHNKRNVGVVLLFLAIIAIPLYLSYNRIVEQMVFEDNWQNERFLLNEKYIMVREANFSRHGEKGVIFMEILTRELLTRDDLNQLKLKIESNFSEELLIRVNPTFIP